MKDLLAIIEAIGSNIKLEVNGSDLQRFAEQLIEKARNELSDSINNTRTERYLTKAEVMDILRVCDTTL